MKTKHTVLIVLIVLVLFLIGMCVFKKRGMILEGLTDPPKQTMKYSYSKDLQCYFDPKGKYKTEKDCLKAYPIPVKIKKYSCIKGECKKVINGKYNSHKECNKKCSKPTPVNPNLKYSCSEPLSGKCTVDPKGRFRNKKKCDKQCHPVVEPSGNIFIYDCVKGKCVINKHGNGKHQSLEDCSKNCKPDVKPDTSSHTLTRCSPVVNVSYYTNNYTRDKTSTVIRPHTNTKESKVIKFKDAYNNPNRANDNYRRRDIYNTNDDSIRKIMGKKSDYCPVIMGNSNGYGEFKSRSN